MLDTVRADMLSLYDGNLRLENIDRLAKNSIVFRNAVAPGTYTLPSHLSIFLGRRPRAIGELMKDRIKSYNESTDPYLKKLSYVKDSEITLAKHLSYLGYETALFSNNPFISSSAGVSSGFSHVENVFVEDKLKESSMRLKVLLGMINNDTVRNNILRLSAGISKIFPDEDFDRLYLRLRKKVDRHYSEECGYYNLDTGSENTNNRIKDYLKAGQKSPSFLFVNYMEGHEGYPTNLVTDKYIVQDKWLHIIGHNDIEDAKAEKTAYMKRIDYLDNKIGELLKILKSKGVLDNAYVVIAGDHGQAFMEHGQMYHNMFPYNEIVRVPLIISRFKDGIPVDKGKEVDGAFSLTELNKLIPEMAFRNRLDLKDNAQKAVVSDHLGITEVWDTYLLRLIKSRSRHADKIYKKKLYFNRFASAIFYGNYKLIHFYRGRKDEMYRMDDPKEEYDIIDANRNLAHRMLECNRTVS